MSDKVIIWGYNYFSAMLSPSRNFIVWRKLTISETFTMAMAELAWTNIPGNAKVIQCAPQNKERFHPTQKPVYIYQKLLQWYAKPGYKILDTHLGSGSIALACIDFACDLTGCEIDPDYYHGIMRRIEAYQKQKPLFDMVELMAQQGERSLFDGEGEQW